MSDKNSNANELINYIEKIIKKKLRKKIKNDIDVSVFTDVSKEYEELNYEYKKYFKWVEKCQYSHPDNRSQSFSEQLFEKCNYLIKRREALDNKIIYIVTTQKLFKKNLFIKCLEKLKLIIKNFFDTKKNDILINNNSKEENKTEIDILKCNFNKNEINANNFKNQISVNKCKQNSLKI